MKISYGQQAVNFKQGFILIDPNYTCQPYKAYAKFVESQDGSIYFSALHLETTTYGWSNIATTDHDMIIEENSDKVKQAVNWKMITGYRQPTYRIYFITDNNHKRPYFAGVYKLQNVLTYEKAEKHYLFWVKVMSDIDIPDDVKDKGNELLKQLNEKSKWTVI